MDNVSYLREKEMATISSRGQLVIPKDFRQKLGIKAGDFIGLVRMDDLVIMKKLDFEDEKVGKKVRKAKANREFGFEELLYPEK
jgi:AbrB family looped-hinge helix DNA binding protein